MTLPVGSPEEVESAHDFCRRNWICLASPGGLEKSHSNACLALEERDRARDASWAEEVRLLREALTEIADREIDWREGSGKNVAWLQEIAEKAIEQADRVAGRRK